MTDPKAIKTIQRRQSIQKEKLIERLKKIPIVEVACKQVGIARSSYYRWRKDDEDFATQSTEAIQDGRLYINDLAESKLVTQIQDQNMTAIIFWLKHNHPSYTTKIEITKGRDTDPNLTPEQQAIVEKALQLTRPLPAVINNQKNTNNVTE